MHAAEHYFGADWFWPQQENAPDRARRVRRAVCCHKRHRQISTQLCYIAERADMAIAAGVPMAVFAYRAR